MTSMSLGTLSLNPSPYPTSSLLSIPANSATLSPAALSMKKIDVHLEVRLFSDSVASPAYVKARVFGFLEAHIRVYRHGPLLDFSSFDPFLHEHVQSLVVTELGSTNHENAISSWRATPHVHVYALFEGQHVGGTDFALDTDGAHGNRQDSNAESPATGPSSSSASWSPAAFTSYVCPCPELLNVWESIHVAPSSKQMLLALAESAMNFSLAGVDPSLVSGNRLILLYGAPGTGKTSLARGLAQKLAIRHGDRFAAVELLSVNAHALLSKFFGESSALVGRVFGSIREKVAEETATLFLLAIDEVETICASREIALAKGSNEPSDAVRVVNAVLTEIDRLRAFRNVLTVATSNITQALDTAFLDRCDLKLHVGLPEADGRYAILRSVLSELIRVKILAPAVPLPERLDFLSQPASPADEAPGSVVCTVADTSSFCSPVSAPSSPPPSATVMAQQEQRQICSLRLELIRLVEQTEGASGRALRKLPLLAHALLAAPRTITVASFVGAMQQALRLGKIELE